MDDSLSLSATGVYSKYSNTYIDTTKGDSDESNSYMNFDSYLKLLVSQMQNQDFNDPMSDSEVLNQMAQYSMLEGIKNMTQQSNISYATSLVGKVVTVSDGYDYYTGKVESVMVSDGEPALMIDGKAYKSNFVTDIVDDNIYSELKSMIGESVRVTSTGATGTITDVVFYSGAGFVVVDDKDAYLVSSVEIIENENGTETDTEGSAETTDETLVVGTSEVQSYETKSRSLIDTFMKELDAVSGVSETSAVNEIDDNYIIQTAYLEVPDYGAGVYADNSVITSTVSLRNIDNTYGSGSGTVTRTSEVSLDPETAERTASGKLKGVTTAPGVSESDCVPHRISVEDYPEEAALADELGTRMYDIRYINNTDITSRIKTDEVIGYTQSGQAITEIGYSGVGQLGEVVTFADGTQRVEILLKSGKSTWMMTSGNLTLDEICTRTGAPGSLTGKLTAFEQAIRHYSHPMEEYENKKSSGFKDYVISNY